MFSGQFLTLQVGLAKGRTGNTMRGHRGKKHFVVCARWYFVNVLNLCFKKSICRCCLLDMWLFKVKIYQNQCGNCFHFPMYVQFFNHEAFMTWLSIHLKGTPESCSVMLPFYCWRYFVLTRNTSILMELQSCMYDSKITMINWSFESFEIVALACQFDFVCVVCCLVVCMVGCFVVWLVGWLFLGSLWFFWFCPIYLATQRLSSPLWQTTSTWSGFIPLSKAALIRFVCFLVTLILETCLLAFFGQRGSSTVTFCSF